MRNFLETGNESRVSLIRLYTYTEYSEEGDCSVDCDHFFRPSLFDKLL